MVFIYVDNPGNGQKPVTEFWLPCPLKSSAFVVSTNSATTKVVISRTEKCTDDERDSSTIA